MADSGSPKLIENIIPILSVKDLSVSLAYYEKALGFSTKWSADGFACLTRDGWNLYVSEGDQGQPGTWIWMGLEDIDRMYQECQSKGATIQSELSANDWGREFRVEDPDGHIIRFGG